MSDSTISSYLDDIQLVLTLNQKLQQMPIGLKQPIVNIVRTLDQLLDTIKSVGQRIQHFTSDNYLSLEEAADLVEILEKLLREIEFVLESHESNKQYLNLLIMISSWSGKLVTPVVYLSDISKYFDTYDGVKQTGYYLDGESKMQIYQSLDKVINFGSEPVDTISIEQHLITLLVYMATVSPLITEDVMYVNKSSLLRQLELLIDKYQSSLRPLVKFYKEALLEKEIKNALDGITRILEHPDMMEQQQVKLSGLIMRVDGYRELNRLRDNIGRL